MRRCWVSGLTVLLVGALAGCAGQDPPKVTFAAHGQSVDAAPRRLCDASTLQCGSEDPSAVVRLPVPPGQPLQISLPEEVAKTPWGVTFSYLDRTGKRQDGSSKLFFNGEQQAYTLTLPDPADRLLLADVQQVIADPKGNPVTLSEWTLQANS